VLGSRGADARDQTGAEETAQDGSSGTALMIVVITGGRNYDDQARVDEILDTLHRETGIEMLGHGDASGADSLADKWAKRRGVRVTAKPATWDDIDTPPVLIRVRDGKPYNVLAGFRRNTEMLDEWQPHLVVVFPGGRGTAHCRREALKRRIAILDVDA